MTRSFAAMVDSFAVRGGGWRAMQRASTAAAQCGGPGRAASSADRQAAFKAAGSATCAPHIPTIQKQRATHPEVVALLTSGHSMRSDGFQRAGDGFQNSAQSAAGFSPWMPCIVHAICDSDLTKSKVSAPQISTVSQRPTAPLFLPSSARSFGSTSRQIAHLSCAGSRYRHTHGRHAHLSRLPARSFP